MNKKVVVIGCGNVGASYCYALVNNQTMVNELVLIDKNNDKAEGEAMDLNHCLAYTDSNIKIYAGDYSDCLNASIVVICAGANQKLGETRLDLINKNSVIFNDIVDNVCKSGFTGIFLIATNPVDVMSYLVYKYSGFDSSRVIGTGTSLDTARCKYLVGKKIGINPKDVNLYVVGEHGDSEFVTWSSANVGMQAITDFINYDDMNEISFEVKNSAYEIIKRKEATYYGIGVALEKITRSILSDDNSIVPVSMYDSINDLYIGLPCIINSNGAKRIYIDLNEEETKKLENSMRIVKKAIDMVGDSDEYI